MPGRVGVSEELYSGNLYRRAGYFRILAILFYFPEHTYLPVDFKSSRICKAMKIFPPGLASRDFYNLFTERNTSRSI
jgi:hypothetical protein